MKPLIPPGQPPSCRCGEIVRTVGYEKADDGSLLPIENLGYGYDVSDVILDDGLSRSHDYIGWLTVDCKSRIAVSESRIVGWAPIARHGERLP